MNTPLYIYDPTASDKLGNVRGAGRYLQVLKLAFPGAAFVSDITKVPYESIFINPFFEFLKAPLITKRIAKKQIAVIHDLIPLKYPHKFPAGIRGTFRIISNKMTLRIYDGVITDSEASRHDITHILNIPEQNIHIAYPPIHDHFFHPPALPPREEILKQYGIPDKPYLIYVGDATWNKNLIAMAGAIKEANITCVIVGNVFTNGSHLRTHRTHPEHREYIGFMDEIQHDKRFIKTGFVDDITLLALYTYATANILVSRDEGFGYSFGEAAALHTPSILSDIPVFREVSEGNAAFADPSDHHSIAKAIHMIATDNFMRNELAAAGYQSAMRFSTSAFNKSLEGLLYQSA